MTTVRTLQPHRVLLRTGAVSSALGVVSLFVAEAFHGGHEPGNLTATLPVYAANPVWEIVHIGQFLGYLLLLVGLVALCRSIDEGAGAAVAWVGSVVAVVAVAIFGANQAVDGVAIKFVAEQWVDAAAEQWVDAAAAQKAEAFRPANPVRRAEIGLTSFSQLTLGLALVLSGLATALGRTYPRLLGWTGMALGAVYVAAGVLVAHNGFTLVGFTAMAGLGLALWFLFLAVALWRKGGEEAQDSGGWARVQV